MRFYEVTLGSDRDGERRLKVASPTDVQAGDAAAGLMRTGESILSIREVIDDGFQNTDAGPPRTQAEEMAPATPGMAATEQKDRRP